MKTLNIKNMKSAFLYSVLITAGGLLALFLSEKIMKSPDPLNPESVLVYILPIAFAVAALFLSGMNLKVSRKSFSLKETFSKGWYIILSSALVFGISFFTMSDKQPFSFKKFGILVIVSFLTAVFEEILMRGTVQNIMIEGFKKSGKSAWKGILAASLVFSLIHFANLYDKPYLIVGTFSQVIYTFALGVMLGTVYYYSGNIFSPIVLHALFNILGSASELWMKSGSASETDITLFAAAVQIIIVLPGIAVARSIYKRNKKQKTDIENFLI